MDIPGVCPVPSTARGTQSSAGPGVGEGSWEVALPLYAGSQSSGVTGQGSHRPGFTSHLTATPNLYNPEPTLSLSFLISEMGTIMQLLLHKAPRRVKICHWVKCLGEDPTQGLTMTLWAGKRSG